MLYFNDSRIWLNVAIGFAAVTIILAVARAIRIADIVLLSEKLSLNAYTVLWVIVTVAIMAFQVWYDGYLVDHYHDYMPYVGAFIVGEILALGVCFPLLKLEPR